MRRKSNFPLECAISTDAAGTHGEAGSAAATAASEDTTREAVKQSRFFRGALPYVDNLNTS
jgi:hypothetical protein